MRFDPRHLIQFATIFEEGSFTRAAEVLGIAQPALSKTVAQLEGRLGQGLFLRRRRPVEPTELGRMLALHGIQLRSILDEAGQTAALMAQGRQGTLRIGAPPFFAEEVLPQLVTGFHDTTPGVGFEMSSAYAPDLRQRVAERRLDLALVPMESDSAAPWLRQHHLADIDHAVVARPQAVPAPGTDLVAALSQGQWINHAPRSILRGYTQHALSRMGVMQANVIATSESGSAVVGMLLTVDCFAVLPVMSILPQLRSGQLGVVARLPGLPVLPFGLITQAGAGGPPLVDAFQRFARSVFQRLAAEGASFMVGAPPGVPGRWTRPVAG